MQSNRNLWAVSFKITRKMASIGTFLFKGWLKIQTHLHTQNAFTIDKLINQTFSCKTTRSDFWICGL